MKVLTINTSPAYYDGITNVIININHAINKEKLVNDLVVVAKPTEQFIASMANENTRVFYFCRSKKKIFKYMISLIELIKKNHYDIVHIHGNSHTTVLELMCAFLAGCRVRIVHAHNTYCVEKMIHILATPLFNLLCTGRMACGEAAGKFMHGNKKFIIINNGIDTNRFSFDEKKREMMREKFDLKENIVIGHVGALYNSQKNQCFLFEVFQKLYKRNEMYHLCCIGEGPDREKFMKRIQELDLTKNVTFIGAVADVAPYLSMFDLVIMPSNYEGLPLSLIEEQANGLVCFVSDNITNEVDKTGNIHFLALSMGANRWADQIEGQMRSYNRYSYSRHAVKSIIDQGYDIHYEANKLLRCYYRYIDKCRKKEKM